MKRTHPRAGSYSELTEEQQRRITELERKIAETQAAEPKPPLDAYEAFYNKQFNQVRNKMPHLKTSEI